jgi:hypothetical protein
MIKFKKIRIYFLFFSVIFGATDLIAQESINDGVPSKQETIIQIEGLSFNCPECVVHGDRTCSVPMNGEIFRVSCDEAIRTLLEKVDYGTTGADSTYPKVSELIAYLGSADISAENISSVMELLLNISGADVEIRKESDRLIRSHHAELSNLIQSSQATSLENRENMKAFLSSVYLASATDPSLIKLRALLTIKSFELPSEGVEQFISDLSIVDAQRDAVELQVLGEVLEELGVSEAFEVSQIRERLFVCGSKKAWTSNSALVDICTVNQLKSFSSAKFSYLQRVVLQNLIATYKSGKLDAPKVISIISEINYRQLGTPALQEILISALSAEDVSSETVNFKSVEPLLIYFSGINKAIAKLTAEKFKEMNVIYGAKKSKGSNIVGLIVGIFCFLALVILFFKFRATKRYFSEDRGQAVLNQDELTDFRRELRESLLYFGLTAQAKESELHQRYRSLAKDMHPDAGGDVRKFADLNERYKVAQQLLAKKIRS